MDDLRAQRLEKLKALQSLGVKPYAYKFDRTHFTADIIQTFENSDTFEESVSIAGRLMSVRRMGKASFGHLMDKQGRIQIYVKKDEVGDEAYQIFKLTDIGDFLGIQGKVFRTHAGEITIVVKKLSILSKTLRPLPIVKEKMDGEEKIIYDKFSDKELRYRQRYVDLVVNPEVKETFVVRSGIVSAMRQYLENKGYIEVETPALQPQYGGAFARPFVTHHNALDMELFLRIADELYLKRLIVGGFDGIFEIAKDFRNEGMDRDHNPEFTMMELYVAFHDYYFMMDLVEEMIRTIAEKVLGDLKITYRDHVLDFSKPWKRLSYFEAIEHFTGIDLYQKDMKSLKEAAKKLKLDIDKDANAMQIIDYIFSEHVEPNLMQPTFIIDYPVELSPLAKMHRSIEGLVERFEGYIACKEICNAFSELNDPIDQFERLREQAELRAGGDEEAMAIDEDYIRAMEYGMPPTAGLGVGVDRLCMLLTNAPSIRDVILFPHMRPESPAEKDEER